MPTPRDIFNKFSETARRVLVTTQKIAEDMNSGIGSQHLLLALAITPGTLAYDLLHAYNVKIDQIRLILSLSGLKNRLPQGLSPEIQRVLERAALAASHGGHRQIEPEHLLSAIVSDPKSVGFEVILRLGVNPSHLKQELENQLSQEGETEMLEEEGLPEAIFPEPRIRTRELKKTVATPALDYFTVDLTRLASEGKLDPVIGREKEIQRAIQILSRRTKNNPVLVGDPGVGKTAIVEGLAQRIVTGEVPNHLSDKRIVNLDLALLVAGTSYRGQFEERIKKILQEVTQAANIILFIDEVHTMVGAGSAEGSMDAGQILKPGLAKGQIRMIGATTQEEYRKYIEKDAALERRFQKILIEEPSEEETMAILKGLRERYEEHHRVRITDEAIAAAVSLSKRYIQDRFLPDKAIDLIDEASAATHLVPKEATKSQEEKQKEIVEMVTRKNEAIERQNFEEAARLRDREQKMREELLALQSRRGEEKDVPVIAREQIAAVVSMWTGIPVTSLVKDDRERLLHLEDLLKKRIIGQDEAISTIAQAIRRNKSGIGNPNRPIGSFLFLGPTGVGKTELVKVLAKEIYGKEEALIKVDMSEFMERHTISRLVGAPPGYVGYEEAGKLTETIRNHPYSVVLLDEIEKAHPDVFNILLQIMEDGYLTDAKGRKVSFKNTILVLTSNLGTEELTRASIGFKSEATLASAENEFTQMKETVMQSLKERFRPEILNRLDKIIVFRPLGREQIRQIVDLQLSELAERLQNEGVSIIVDQKVKDLIAEKGFDPHFGARPIRRTIADFLEDPLSEKMIEGRLKKGDRVRVGLKKDKTVEFVK
jgi:ATP-dependent Clp protease ATP-binding subunit ClpC